MKGSRHGDRDTTVPANGSHSRAHSSADLPSLSSTVRPSPNGANGGTIGPRPPMQDHDPSPPPVRPSTNGGNGDRVAPALPPVPPQPSPQHETAPGKIALFGSLPLQLRYTESWGTSRPSHTSKSQHRREASSFMLRRHDGTTGRLWG